MEKFMEAFTRIYVGVLVIGSGIGLSLLVLWLAFRHPEVLIAPAIGAVLWIAHSIGKDVLE